jgi:hypothetical protein
VGSRNGLVQRFCRFTDGCYKIAPTPPRLRIEAGTPQDATFRVYQRQFGAGAAYIYPNDYRSIHEYRFFDLTKLVIFLIVCAHTAIKIFLVCEHTKIILPKNSLCARFNF